MKTSFGLFMGLVALHLAAQSVGVPDSTGMKHEASMLLGLSSRAAMQQEPFNVWFNEEYVAYALNMEVLDPLKARVDGIEIEIYMGTWCSDSRREVPRLYRITDHLGLESDGAKVIMLDRDMESPGHDEEGMNIHHVPTVVFYQEGLELGRIIETPVKSLEEDIQSIITGEVYIPNYIELE
jgi:hypothetical protein